MLLSQIPAYYKSRRDQLVANHPDSVFIFPAHPNFIRNSDVHHFYRQDSNLYYLTGFEEPESCLVLAPNPSTPGSYRTVLFLQSRDPEREMWDGERYGIEGALQVFEADEALPIEELGSKLAQFFQGAKTIYYHLGFSGEMDRIVIEASDHHRRKMGRSGSGLLPIEDSSSALGEMRLFKSPHEVQQLRQACEISAEAHRAAMKEAKPGMNEGEVEALIDYTLRRGGCQRVGYGSIVATGRNATCLHYRSNNQNLKLGDLLLIDAGGEYGYYTSDITRTFPVGKQFTKAQAELYDLVLSAQKAAIASVKPGITLPQIHKQVSLDLIEGMLSLGLLTGDPEAILKAGGHRRFYPHSTSHWLGSDVHDAGLYITKGEPRLLEPGMVFTIEPGFYVQPSDKDVPEKYRDIGIRIEDDILVTKKGHEVLSRNAPKERAEIEALRA